MLRTLLLYLTLVVPAMAQEAKPITVQNSHGTFQWKETTYASNDTAQVISALVREVTPDELKQLDSDADRATDFISRYVPASKRDKDLLENLDSAFAAWLHSTDATKESDKDVIRIVGASYGRYCISHLGVRWAIIKDEYGTDTALVRENPTTRSYPFTSIQYRIEDKKTDFIYGLVCMSRCSM